jgi:hypothetical protein
MTPLVELVFFRVLVDEKGVLYGIAFLCIRIVLVVKIVILKLTFTAN